MLRKRSSSDPRFASEQIFLALSSRVVISAILVEVGQSESQFMHSPVNVVLRNTSISKLLPTLVTRTSTKTQGVWHVLLVGETKHRAKKNCSEANLATELDRLRNMFVKNGYFDDFIQNIITQRLKTTDQDETYGPQKCPACLTLSYIGHSASRYTRRLSTLCRAAFTIYNFVVLKPVLSDSKQSQSSFFSNFWFAALLHN